ncbi:MGMT family protein [Methanobacterium sp. ACI-7]|uniref:MGMT family protein n=1 Tax=unclassified Methanobacterium TaxID=2627676 RepID=UPI0039C22310
MPKENKKDALTAISKGFDSYTLSDEYCHFAKLICNLYYGKEDSIKKEELYLNFNEFQEKVLLEVMKIPKGEVKTYKQISEAINSKAYRAVGTAIGKNPLPLIIPCHRVIRSDFNIGGFFGGTKMKKEILENEGICIENEKIKQQFLNKKSS